MTCNEIQCNNTWLLYDNYTSRGNLITKRSNTDYILVEYSKQNEQDYSKQNLNNI